MAKPSCKQVKKKLLRLTAEVPSKEFSDQSHMVRFFAHKLSMQKEESRIIPALESLEAEGVLVLTRKGNRVTGFGPVPDDARLGLLSSSPTARRNAMFAGDTPYFLRDSMCTPVEISYLPGFGPEAKKLDLDMVSIETEAKEMPRVNLTKIIIPKTKEDNMVESAKLSKSEQMLVDVNRARIALQDASRADEGILRANSCVAVIRDSLGCGKNRANAINTYLGKVDPPVRISMNTGGGTWEHAIDLDRGEVTAAEIRAVNGTKDGSSVMESAASTNEVVDTVSSDAPSFKQPEPVWELPAPNSGEQLEIPASSESQSEVSAADSQTEGLLKVIDLLEEKINTLTSENEQLAADLAGRDQDAQKMTKLYEEANDLVAEKQSMIDSLNARLGALSAVSSKVDSVLKRYNV